MRPLAIFASVLALAPGALSVAVEKSVLVTYNNETPSLMQLVDQAKDAVRKAGGRITHEFNLIHGFHAIVSADVVEAIKEWGGNYITVEEDKPVTIMKAGGH